MHGRIGALRARERLGLTKAVSNALAFLGDGTEARRLIQQEAREAFPR